jgi:hypothetical protein
MPRHSASTDGPERFSHDAALRRERVAIWGPAGADDPSICFRQTALCLSGGGIRSAAFCLGVLQSLAKAGLLDRFHYLSTVSGGGYIGGWLQAWLLRHARQDNPEGSVDDGDIAAVAQQLASGVAEPVKNLRDYTNFLTPEAGLASRDTWAAITLYIRNMLINWAIFLPALFALSLFPQIYKDVLARIPDWASRGLLAVALLGAGLAVYFTSTRLPSHDTGTSPDYPDVGTIGKRSVAPALIWAGVLPLSLAPFLIGEGDRLSVDGLSPVFTVPIATFIVLNLAYTAAWVRTAWRGRDAWLFRASLLPWIIACLFAATVLGGEILLAKTSTDRMLRGPELVAIFGPAAAMLSHLCLSSAFVALRLEVKRSDLDREWLARLSAVKFLPTLLWGALAAICLLGSDFVASLSLHLGPIWSTVSAIVPIASGAAAAVFGGSKRTSPLLERLNPFDAIASVLTLIFVVGLLTYFSYLGAALLERLTRDTGPWISTLLEGAVPVVSVAVAYVLGGNINVNRFSLQGVYRNRLIRAFLGSARSTRSPDPFTDFDPDDNLSLRDLLPAEGKSRRLFPVIGTTLNLVRGAAKAGQERKGAPFTITPAASGFQPRNTSEPSFVATGDYAGMERDGGGSNVVGMSLGTAIALSGAAVSPNMGYHSSPSTAFLMTLFNVRLGGWLPNPACEQGGTLRTGKPPNALWALVSEMLGLTDEDSPAIYLSDGGHFDNLGVYEMIRRRCTRIVAVDAGQDGEFQFADLSAVVRKVRIDFDVEITFDMPMSMVVEKAWRKKNRAFALARVTYPACPDEGLPAMEGQLLYIKSCRLPNMTIDVRGYTFEDEDFPADTTADQFFNESKFESYRRLGEFIGDNATAAAAAPAPDAVTAADAAKLKLGTFFEDIRTAP